MYFLIDFLLTILLLVYDTNGDVSPSVGSLGGGTRITISGGPFSEDPHNSGGNVVIMESSGGPTLSCAPEDYLSNLGQIVCVTQNSGHG